MSGKDRRKYLSATALDQDLLDWCHDNLECRLEIVCDIQQSSETIRVSDRNKYIVDSNGTGYFYSARTNIPVITRTLGDWLVPELQFSTVQLAVSNVDGIYNKYLPGGANYEPWINKQVTVRMGLAELGSSYVDIFSGRVTDVGGVKRDTKAITLVARDVFDRLTAEFPKQVLTRSPETFPYLEDANVGKFLPVIYGDWTTSLEPDKAVVPAIAVNGANPYVNVQDEAITDAQREDVDLVITNLPLSYFDTSNVYLKSSDNWFQVPASEITMLGTENNRFSIRQMGTWRGGEAYKYSAGDTFYVRVKGKDLGAYSDNIVWQARDILITYGGITAADFDSTWAQYRDKETPSQSAIKLFKSRVCESEPKQAIQYALSLLEQVRLEAFISRDQKLRINSLHFEDWVPKDFTLTNFDISAESFGPFLDDRNTFNRARGAFDFHPSRNENAQATPIYRNQLAITKLAGKELSKQIVFPNLYQASTVESQVTEILKIASSTLENAQLSATWRSALLELGDIVTLNVKIGSIVYENVPAMIREIGYDPVGLKLPMRLWVLQLCPYNAANTVYPGTTGGYNATITAEEYE